VLYAEDGTALPDLELSPARETKEGRSVDFHDPSEIYFVGKTQTIERVKGGYQLVLPIPFVTSEQVVLSKHGDELAVTVGNWRRTFVVPRVLVGLQAKDATVKDGNLVVTFQEQAEPQHATG